MHLDIIFYEDNFRYSQEAYRLSHGSDRRKNKKPVGQASTTGANSFGEEKKTYCPQRYY